MKLHMDLRTFYEKRTGFLKKTGSGETGGYINTHETGGHRRREGSDRL
jgi:hypothetical protein